MKIITLTSNVRELCIVMRYKAIIIFYIHTPKYQLITKNTHKLLLYMIAMI